ncbi:hypothetical protein DERP_001369 [Dermatophagoides pteronyssinus]|uniref:Uncharacterized protein n=1 Tax=Dermatophagoides pteronyssinus TaxID=6956 RepID=A0ABQ8JE86_DERPT|nr:hypothetical protein DERP_001369 [Dermatophagoides pteronyssinus]
MHAVPEPNISSRRFSASNCFTSAIVITRSITSISFCDLISSIKDCLVTPEPSLRSPEPPCQALTYFGSASNDTGLKPVLKYGPTGPVTTNSIDLVVGDTPKASSVAIIVGRIYILQEHNEKLWRMDVNKMDEREQFVVFASLRFDSNEFRSYDQSSVDQTPILSNQAFLIDL